MCPAITAGPMAPGRGLRTYQPATAVDDGTCRAPVAVTPRSITLDRTPMEGMISVTGCGTFPSSCDLGRAAIGPIGTGSEPALANWTATGCRFNARPTVPALAMITPVASANAAIRFLDSVVMPTVWEADADRAHRRPRRASPRRREPARAA